MKPEDDHSLAQRMGYYVLDMWVVTSVLLMIIFVLNALHTFSFVYHVYHKRMYLMQNEDTLGTNRAYYMNGAAN